MCMVTYSMTGEGLSWLRTEIPSPQQCIATVYIALNSKTLAINQPIFGLVFVCICMCVSECYANTTPDCIPLVLNP